MSFSQQLKRWYHKHKKEIIKDYCDFLSFASISTEAKYKQDLLACCRWLTTYVKKIGLDVEVVSTPHYPVIVASTKEKKKPTLLFYGHYDVQPVDPIDQWKTDPFTPTIKGDKIFARGASDNKGQLFYTLCALKAFKEIKGSFSCSIKCVFEGEEEASSVGIEKALRKIGKKITADCLIVPDVDIPSMTQPAITIGARGIAALDLTLQGSKDDLHSGAYGNIAFNPLRALSLMLSTCWDKKGHIAIPDFYDNVRQITQKEKDALMINSSIEKESTKGIFATWKEEGYSLVEGNWIRPTFEINGISGGYTGDGFKTVIPSTARAKISCRLVPDQDPLKISKKVEKYLKEITPKGMKLTINYLGGGKGIFTSPDTSFAHSLRSAYEEVLKKPCGNMLTGGSVPIIDKLKRYTKDTFLMMGVALPTDLIHAPNEHFSLSRLEKGCYIVAQMIEKL